MNLQELNRGLSPVTLLGLIGREMFAIDGVKLPSNASKAKSGTRAEFMERAAKLETAAKAMLARHRAEDAKPEPAQEAKEAKRVERLTRDAKQIRDWLESNPAERKGAKGTLCKSNLTDNESAKMATSKGVIQGYCGVAAVDAKHQVIVDAQRFATVEPVFGNIRHNKRLDRFTLRGQVKVDAQWKLYCLVHNIEKLAHHGFAVPKVATKSG